MISFGCYETLYTFIRVCRKKNLFGLTKDPKIFNMMCISTER
jgi:hypothetical protein